MALSDAEQRELLTKVRAVFDIVADNQVQLRGPGLSGWPQLGREPAGNRTLVDAFAAVMKKLSA